MRAIRWAMAVLTVVLLQQCKNTISDIQAVTETKVMPVQTTYNADYIYSEDGKTKNKLHAAILERFETDQPYLHAEGGFTMLFFDSLEQQSAQLTANQGTYYDRENKLVAWDHVQVRNVRDEHLETEELIFVQDSDRIYTDKFVSITTQNGIFNGTGLESNAGFTRFRILQPTGNIYVADPTKK
jgi:LPS export ABC transporter protein LptC